MAKFSPEILQDIAASSHTYDSFGRAIISQVLRSIGKADGPLNERVVDARFSVRPIGGPVDLAHCVEVTVTVGDNTYVFAACVELT
ncbi:hypothetical protein ABID19_005309 [Mesorhizobium robiniae]|uniref:Uncharacterized protein n=1 Tax=Mesorhizobium robiniae TaxID=559315 RepID=A0ABV2GVD4_9HYPH